MWWGWGWLGKKLHPPASKSTPVKLVAHQSSEFGFKLQYPEGFVLGKVPSEQKKNPIMLRLVRLEPPTLMTLWKETGLGILDLTIKKPLLYYLKTNIDRKYSHDFQDFKKEKIEDTTLGDLEAFTAWFTFQDPQKSYREKIKLTVAEKDKQAWYLQCLAPEAMWELAEPSCDLVKNSFAFLP